MDFGVILGDANGWETDSLSDAEPDLEAPPSPPPSIAPSLSPKKRGDKSHHSIGARIQALTIFTTKGNTPTTFQEIWDQTKVSRASVYKIRTKAVSRGWKEGSIIEIEHVDDAPRSRRPKTSTATALFIIEVVTKNSTNRGWSCARIAQEVSSTPGRQPVSASTVYRVMKENGYGVFKRTVKPGLQEEDKAARLKWCLEHEHLTLKDWKNVIFSDETSVQLGGVRGKRRVWRKKGKTYHHHCTTRRWKGFSEFMW
jgi:hypothetical protein